MGLEQMSHCSKAMSAGLAMLSTRRSRWITKPDPNWGYATRTEVTRQSTSHIGFGQSRPGTACSELLIWLLQAGKAANLCRKLDKSMHHNSWLRIIDEICTTLCALQTKLNLKRKSEFGCKCRACCCRYWNYLLCLERHHLQGDMEGSCPMQVWAVGTSRCATKQDIRTC